MRVLSAVCLAGALSAASAEAQNFVTNGDFSGATIAPWTASGSAVGAGLTSFDVNGAGASQCYAARPGGTVPHRLDQPVNWLPIVYELTMDVAHVPPTLSNSLVLGRVDVFAGNQVVASVQFTVSRLRRTLQRARLCARFKPTTTGRGTIGVALGYRGNATTSSPRLLIDNVELRPSRDAQFCIVGDRILGQSVSFEVTGEASAAFLVLLSPTELPTKIKIPGIGGEFALGLQILIPFLQGALDQSGRFAQSLTIPNLQGIAGTKLYWQALQVATSGASLGWHSQQAFYQ